MISKNLQRSILKWALQCLPGRIANSPWNTSNLEHCSFSRAQDFHQEIPSFNKVLRQSSCQACFRKVSVGEKTLMDLIQSQPVCMRRYWKYLTFLYIYNLCSLMSGVQGGSKAFPALLAYDPSRRMTRNLDRLDCILMATSGSLWSDHLPIVLYCPLPSFTSSVSNLTPTWGWVNTLYRILGA